MMGKDSRYARCLLYRDTRGQTMLGRRPKIDTSPQPDDRFHTVTEGERIDALAYRYLGDARLWWVIADTNALFFPLELEVGAVLRIPSARHVQMRVLD